MPSNKKHQEQRPDPNPLLLDVSVDPEILRRERVAARPSLEELFSNLSDKTSRDERIYQAVRCHHYKLREVGDHLGRHFSTISVITKRGDQSTMIRK